MEGTNTAINALGTALADVSSQAQGALSTALPYALAVMGAIVVVTIGIKVFKKFSK